MNLLKYIVRFCGEVCSYLVTPQVVAKINHLQLDFHSRWVRRSFAECGYNCTIGKFSALVGAKYIHLADNLYVGKNVVWEVYDSYDNQRFSPILSFGEGSSFGDNGHISCINKISIGKGVRIGRCVFISDNAHGASIRDHLDIPANKRPMTSKGPVLIEDNVWIGEGAFIMPGVTIGRGTIVGAGSVVTRNLPPYCVAAGNPARIVKEL